MGLRRIACVFTECVKHLNDPERDDVSLFKRMGRNWHGTKLLWGEMSSDLQLIKHPTNAQRSLLRVRSLWQLHRLPGSCCNVRKGGEILTHWDWAKTLTGGSYLLKSDIIASWSDDTEMWKNVYLAKMPHINSFTSCETCPRLRSLDYMTANR